LIAHAPWMTMLASQHRLNEGAVDMRRSRTGQWLFVLIAGIAGTSCLRAEAPASQVSGADAAAIRQTALDYIEGWYTGDAARMERALHPELAKRIVTSDRERGSSRFGHMGAMQLVQGTRSGGGKDTPKESQLKEVTILDVYQNAASVKIVASGWIDYLHVAKWNGSWKIVNVLWELKPEKQ
jgi:hypothetical protein